MKLLLLHLPYHDPKQGRIIMQKETVIQKSRFRERKQTKQNTQPKHTKKLLLFSSLPPQSYIIYSQSIRSLVPVIGMMDGSTSAAARGDTAMHHSAGKKTIERTKQQDNVVGRKARGILCWWKNRQPCTGECKNTAWGVCTPCAHAC